jgi:septal ring factor EnvC (AmiA/AmiB activator)
MAKTNNRQIKVKSTEGTYLFFSSVPDSSSDSNVKRFPRINRKILDKDSEEYKRRRKLNNESVKKSREKSRAKFKKTQEEIEKLREENKKLEDKVKTSEQELKFLKDLCYSKTGNTEINALDFRFHYKTYQ